MESTPEPMREIVDLRSDTVTRPTSAMRRAIAEAEVGDAVLGDDPTVAALESYSTELLGKERALFFPSGIMANQTALLAQAPSGSEAIIDAQGHIFNYEEAAAAAWGGIQFRTVPTPDGLLSAEDVRGAIRPSSPYAVRSTLLCLENTHNSAGGRILPLERMREATEVAREHGLAIHLDGARLPNASVATGIPMQEWAALADTVMVALSKGLGGPVGSVLAGSAEVMERAWRIRRRMGGGMRQAGLLAAAGLFALKHNLPVLADDHRRAARLASLARRVPGLEAAEPETNIVMIELGPDAPAPAELLASLHECGVWMTQFGPRRLRAVTHLDVHDEGIERAGEALAACVAREARSASG